jgi:hypothetical protein
MVNLYVWDPPGLSEILDLRILPDLGHAALEVVDAEGKSLVYVSFWPEMESIVGQAIQPFKKRQARNPESYDVEADPDGGYMQRHADYLEPILGLEEGRILRDWAELGDAKYDLTSWNCSNVCKLLLLRAMPPEDARLMGDKLAMVVEDLKELDDQVEMAHALRYLATSSFVDCRPEDVLCLVRAYNDHVAERADATQMAEAV